MDLSKIIILEIKLKSSSLVSIHKTFDHETVQCYNIHCTTQGFLYSPQNMMSLAFTEFYNSLFLSNSPASASQDMLLKDEDLSFPSTSLP